MEQRVKQRLIGAVILVALGVIFIPMLLKGPVERDRAGIPVEIPPRPRVMPVPDIPKADELYEPVSGEPLAERRQSVGAATASSATEAKGLSEASLDERRDPTSILPSSVPGGSAGEAPASGWAVQVGSFQNRDNARALRQELREGGYSTYIEHVQYEHKPLFRVRVGPVAGRGEAERLAARLHDEHGMEGLVVGE